MAFLSARNYNLDKATICGSILGLVLESDYSFEYELTFYELLLDLGATQRSR